MVYSLKNVKKIKTVSIRKKKTEKLHRYEVLSYLSKVNVTVLGCHMKMTDEMSYEINQSINQINLIAKS